MKLGIFGGTFDPIHYGHLLLAEICRQELGLDEVRFVPAGNPPHKSDEVSDGHARADMVGLAVSGYPEFTIDRREIRRAGPSFTVLTLDEIAQENPDSELFFSDGSRFASRLFHMARAGPDFGTGHCGGGQSSGRIHSCAS